MHKQYKITKTIDGTSTDFYIMGLDTVEGSGEETAELAKLDKEIQDSIE